MSNGFFPPRPAARPSALASISCQRSVSLLQADHLRPVADRNCVAVRRGGEQRKANVQSVGIRTRFGVMNRRAC